MKSVKHISKIGLLLAGFALVGQGCLSFGGGEAGQSIGGLWQTADGGRTWDALAALPQASGVGSILGVNVRAIEIDPVDPSAYYIGTNESGMFMSIDNGSTWQRPEDELVRSGTVLDVEVDPRDVCTLYVLKPDRVMKSVNCSRTFETVFVEGREEETLTSLVIDWFNPDILWAGTTDGEILLTSDAGASWSSVQQFKSDITDIIVSNADSRVVIVGTKSKGLQRRDVETGEFISLEADLKEYRKADVIFNLTQTANGSKMLMSNDYGLFVSTDKGATWDPLSLITPPNDVDIQSIAIDAKNDSVIYYASENTFHVSTNAGASWETFEMPTTRAATAMEAHPVNTEVILTGFSVID